MAAKTNRIDIPAQPGKQSFFVKQFLHASTKPTFVYFILTGAVHSVMSWSFCVAGVGIWSGLFSSVLHQSVGIATIDHVTQTNRCDRKCCSLQEASARETMV